MTHQGKEVPSVRLESGHHHAEERLQLVLAQAVAGAEAAQQGGAEEVQEVLRRGKEEGKNCNEDNKLCKLFKIIQIATITYIW